MTTPSTAVSTTGGYTGADVDGLDKLAGDFTEAAQVVDMVKAACEVIVAVASFFGPFGASFIAYLKGTVIPWLTKIGEALKLMAKVLSVHSQAQKDASSSATSLPSYTTPAGLPTTDTTNYPTLGSVGDTSTSALTALANQPGATLTAVPSIGGPAGSTAVPGTTTAAPTTGAPVTTLPITTLPGSTLPGSTLPGSTLPGSLQSGALPPGAAGATGLTGGDTLGMLSVPVRIAPDGTISGLLQTPPSTAPSALTPATALPAGPTPATHAAALAPATTHAAVPTPIATHPATLSGGGSGGGFGGGSGGGFGGGSGGGADPTPIPGSTPALGGTPAIGTHPAVLTSARTPLAPTLHGAGGGGSSHDGLFTGLGQATGIGAGGAALARAVLTEARQRGDGSVLGALPLPFDADADVDAQDRIFRGSLG